MTRITFEGRLTEEEFVRMKNVNFGWPVQVVPWVGLGVVAFILLDGGYASALANPVQLGGRLVLAVALAVALLVLPRWAIRKQWQSEAWPRESVSGVADESGLEWVGPTMPGRYTWQGLFGQRVAKGMALVYPKPARASFLYFPQSFFADESTWRAFLALLSAKGPARK